MKARHSPGLYFSCSFRITSGKFVTMPATPRPQSVAADGGVVHRPHVHRTAEPARRPTNPRGNGQPAIVHRHLEHWVAISNPRTFEIANNGYPLAGLRTNLAMVMHASLCTPN